MSFTAADRLYVSGAGSATFFSTSGGGTLLGVYPNLTSGTVSLSGTTIFVIDAVSGVTNSNSGTILYQYVGGGQSGAAGLPPFLHGPIAFTSGLIAKGAAGTATVVSYSV